MIVAQVDRPNFGLQGAHLTFWHCREPEVILAGPFETGKTITTLRKLNALLVKYPGSHALMVRKTHISLMASTVKTWEEKIHRGQVDKPGYGVAKYGGERPEFYQYDNGSRLILGGLDQAGKFLSAEFDFIYVNQAEEIALDDWQTLTGRATGRAGHAPYPQVMGDCNPGGPQHWILQRKSLRRIDTRHEDNPALYDVERGEWTVQGRRTIETLERLTGPLRQRGRFGLWTTAEGLVYDVWLDLHEAVGTAAAERDPGNVTEKAEYVPGNGRVYWAVDDGYSAGSATNTAGINQDTGTYVANAHPRVFLLCQMRPDGTLCVFAESYACLKLQDEHIAEILALTPSAGSGQVYPRPHYAAVDRSAAELRGRLQKARVPALKSGPSVEEQVKELRQWLGADKNGVRRLLVHPRCKHLRAEMVSYRQDENGKPVKEFDHGPDALKGLTWRLRHTN